MKSKWIPLVMIAATVRVLSAIAAAAEPAAFRFQPITDQSLGIFDGEKPVLVYNHGRISRQETPGARPRACYFHPIYGLDGETLTDDFPKDHLYHRGLYFAWPHIKIGDKEHETWTARGELQQKFRQWLGKETGAAGAKLGIENGWMVGDKLAVREQIWVSVHPASGDSRAIDVVATWTPIDEPLTLSGAEGKSYGGFNFRFGKRTKTTITVPEDTALPTSITATAGRVSGDLLVTKLPWADFVGDFAGAKEPSGAAIFVHPGHRDYPPTWMTRHYGLVSVGWPGVEPQTFPAGQPITCQYRVWIHRGSPSAAVIQKAYDAYRGESK